MMIDGFAIISNLVENRIEIRRRNKPIKIDGTERE